MGIKFNPLTGQFDLTGDSSGGSGGSASYKDPVANYAALPLMGNSDGDVRVTLDTDNIWIWDSGSGSWVLVQQFRVEKFTLDSTDITNKYVTLSASPIIAAKTCLNVIGGIEQDYSVDFTVSSNQLSWNGLTLDGVLVSGDKLIVYYF